MNTQQLRQKILDLAIRGQLVSQDNNDEPASVLLEKIRAEKETLIQQKKIKKDKKSSYITCEKSPYQKEPMVDGKLLMINDKLLMVNDELERERIYIEHFADGTTKDITEEIPFEIPENWAWCRLGEIINLLSGQDLSTKEYNNEQRGIPYITGASNFEKNNLIINRWTDSPKNIAFEKDILITCKGTVGEINILREKEAHIARQIMALKPIFINNHYLSIFLRNKISDLKQVANGLIPGISREDILLQIFPLPPLAEQQRIVAKVEELLALVEDLEANKNDLQTYIQQTKNKVLDMAIRGELVPQNPADEPASVLLERIKNEKPIKKSKKTSDNEHYDNDKLSMVNDEMPFEIPENWAWCRLGEIGNWSAGSTPSRKEIKYYEKGTIPWLKTGDLNDGYINETSEFITELALEKTSLRLNPIGSVLIAMYGATIGKLGILNIESTTNQACCACISYLGINNKFLFFYLLSQKQNIQEKAEGGAQPNISKEKLINFLFPLPPLAEQQRIVAKIEEIFTELDNINLIING